jgi:hypothetical protein
VGSLQKLLITSQPSLTSRPEILVTQDCLQYPLVNGFGPGLHHPPIMQKPELRIEGDQHLIILELLV